MAIVDTGAVLRAPEEGRLVRCRGRMWVVTRTDRSNLPTDELGADRLGTQHVVTLASVEGLPAASVVLDRERDA
jgi:hypothetical protein